MFCNSPETTNGPLAKIKVGDVVTSIPAISMGEGVVQVSVASMGTYGPPTPS